MRKCNSIVCIAVAAMLMSCNGGKTSEPTTKIIPVKVIEVESSASNGDKRYVGTITESFATSLSFAGMGTVEQVLVSAGQNVRKGELLAVLSNASSQNNFDAAQSGVRQAQDAYDRLSKLYSNGSIPEIKYVEAETGLQRAKSQAANAKKALDDCKLYAPCNGVIAERSVEPGANVMPGLAAFKLIGIDDVNVKISVPENEISTTTIGQKASVQVSALNDALFTGVIESKGVSANVFSHTYEVKIALNNPHKNLMPGMVCKVSLKSNTETDHIVIPNRAVQISHDGRCFVWLVEGDVVKRRFVETAGLSNNGVSIGEGLFVGDKIIAEGYQKVSEGMRVSIIQ